MQLLGVPSKQLRVCLRPQGRTSVCSLKNLCRCPAALLNGQIKWYKMQKVRCQAIRLAKLSDLPALVALEQECGNWNQAQVAEEIDRERATILVSDRDGDITGWLIAWNVPPDELQIMEIAVMENHRRQGVATALLSSLLSDHRNGATLVLLEVRLGNKPAISLYERAGFLAVGKRPNFYGDGETALLMNLEVAPVN